MQLHKAAGFAGAKYRNCPKNNERFVHGTFFTLVGRRTPVSSIVQKHAFGFSRLSENPGSRGHIEFFGNNSEYLTFDYKEETQTAGWLPGTVHMIKGGSVDLDRCFIYTVHGKVEG
jgi:hypothetical protein